MSPLLPVPLRKALAPLARFVPAPQRPSHAVALARLENAGAGNAALYANRVNRLAHIVAGRYAPAALKHDIDLPQFLHETGFDSIHYDQGDDEALRYRINHHLLGMELGFSPMFQYVSTSGAPMELNADIQAYETVLDRRTRQRVAGLLPQSERKELPMTADELHKHFSEVVEHQISAEMLIPAVRAFFRSMNGYTEGLAVNCAQLVLMAKGLDVGPLEIAQKDREHLNSMVLDVTTTDGKPAKASLWWLMRKLNAFIASTTPEERGVIKSAYRYNKIDRAIAWVINNRKGVGMAFKSAIQLLAPVLFEGPHGKRVGEMLPDIVDSALDDGNTAFLRLLIRNGQPLMPGRFKPQYMGDVTTAADPKAWGRTLRLKPQKGQPVQSITYAECLRALREAFSDETLERYGVGVASTLARIPMRVEVNDPNGLIEKTGFPFIGVMNHRAYVDIGAGAIALFSNLPRGKRRHQFIAKDELPAMTLGIGTHLMPHQLIERTKGKSEQDVAALKAWTWDAYAKVLDSSIMKIFWQGTRSRFADWRDLKEPGDGILEKKFRSAGLFCMGVAKTKGVPILLMHLKNTGHAFMYEKAHLADVLGLSMYLRTTLRRRLGEKKYAKLQTVVPGTKHMGHIEANILSNYDPSETDPETLIEEMVSAMNEAEGISA